MSTTSVSELGYLFLTFSLHIRARDLDVRDHSCGGWCWSLNVVISYNTIKDLLLYKYRTYGVSIFIDYCTAPRDTYKGGRRRKRHSTSTREWGQQLFCPRLLRVTGRARRAALIKPPPFLSYSAPPPLQAEFMWFSAFSTKSEDGLYLEAQKCCSWIQTAFVIMYEFELKW